VGGGWGGGGGKKTKGKTIYFNPEIRRDGVLRGEVSPFSGGLSSKIASRVFVFANLQSYMDSGGFFRKEQRQGSYLLRIDNGST